MAALAGVSGAWGGRDTCGHIKPRSLQGIDNLGDCGSLDTIFVSQARNNDRCDR